MRKLLKIISITSILSVFIAIILFFSFLLFIDTQQGQNFLCDNLNNTLSQEYGVTFNNEGFFYKFSGELGAKEAQIKLKNGDIFIVNDFRIEFHLLNFIKSLIFKTKTLNEVIRTIEIKSLMNNKIKIANINVIPNRWGTNINCLIELPKITLIEFNGVLSKDLILTFKALAAEIKFNDYNARALLFNGIAKLKETSGFELSGDGSFKNANLIKLNIPEGGLFSLSGELESNIFKLKNSKLLTSKFESELHGEWDFNKNNSICFGKAKIFDFNELGTDLLNGTSFKFNLRNNEFGFAQITPGENAKAFGFTNPFSLKINKTLNYDIESLIKTLYGSFLINMSVSKTDIKGNINWDTITKEISFKKIPGIIFNGKCDINFYCKNKENIFSLEIPEDINAEIALKGIEGYEFKNGIINSDINVKKNTLAVKLNALALRKNKQWKLKLNGRGEGTNYFIEECNLDGDRFSFSIKSPFYISQNGITGKSVILAQELSPLSVFIKHSFHGTGLIHCDFSSDKLNQLISLEGTLVNIRSNNYGFSVLNFKSSFNWPYNKLNLNVTAKDGGYLFNQKFESLKLLCEEKNKEKYKIIIDSLLNKNGQKAGLTADLENKKENLQFKIERFFIDNPEHSISLNSPAFCTWMSEKNFYINSSFKIGNGNADLDFKIQENKIKSSGSFNNVPISILTYLYNDFYQTGFITGQFSLNGSTSNVIGKSSFNLLGVFNNKLDLITEMSFSQGKLHSSILIDEKTKGKLKAELELPFKLSFYPFHIENPINGYVTGSITGKTNLKYFSTNEMTLKGLVNANLKVSGMLNSFDLSGNIILENGFLEIGHSGTCLKNTNVELIARGKTLEIKKAHAIDNSNGYAKASGYIWLAKPPFEFASKIKLDLKRFHILDEDDLEVIADGNTFLEGILPNWTLKGNINIPFINYIIKNVSSSDVGDIKVVELGRVRKPHEKKSLNLSVPCIANLSLNCSDVRVSGKSINTKWNGQLKLVGGLHDPIALVGVVDLQKDGYLDFSGRKIPFVKGKIEYEQKYPMEPIVTLKGRKFFGNTEVKIKIHRDVNNTNVSLSSVPDLPLDAILAQVLFGKPIQTLSSTEMLQLVHAASSFEGGEDPLSTIDQLKNLIGIDTVCVNEPTQNKSRVFSIGKYLTDDIFLKLENEAGAQTTFSIEMALTPVLTLKAEPPSAVGFGFRYRY